LQDLEGLAKEQIEIYGSDMALVEILDTVRKEFSRMDSSWFHEYLQSRAQEQFDLDYTLFTSKAFIESLGKDTLYRFMTSHLLEIFSEKLTHTLHERKPVTALDEVESTDLGTHYYPCYPGGHETDRRTSSNGMSFEFPNAPRGDVDDVITLETSSAPDCANPENAIGEVPPVEGNNNHEEQDMVQAHPTRLCEKPYEPTYANEVEKCEDTAARPVSDLDETTGIKCLEVDGPPESEPTLPEPGKQESDPQSFALSAKTSAKKKNKGAIAKAPLPALPKKKKKNKGAVTEAALPTLKSGAPTEPGPVPEPAPEPEPVNEDDQWGFAATTTGKNEKGKEPEDDPETGKPFLPLPEAELVPVEETPAIDPYAGLSKSQKKKLMVKKALEAEEAAKEDREFWANLVPSATQVGKQKKKGKGVIEKETIPVPINPEPEPAANAEPSLNTEALPEPVQEYKPEPESFPEEAVSVASSTLCPRRPQHLLGGDGWKSCERCRAILGEIAVQLAQENRTGLLS
jgi:hypothetical protein